MTATTLPLQASASDESDNASLAESSSGLPVIWHVIVDLPFADSPFRRTRLSLRDAEDALHRRIEQGRTVERLLAKLRELSAADDWQVTVSWKGVRAERDGESFERLEEQLLDAGFTADDFTIRVEYARSWGML